MINGAAGPFVFGLAPRISAIWFTVSQRTIATSIGNLANALGRYEQHLFFALSEAPNVFLCFDAQWHGVRGRLCRASLI